MKIFNLLLSVIEKGFKKSAQPSQIVRENDFFGANPGRIFGYDINNNKCPTHCKLLSHFTASFSLKNAKV